MDLPFSARTPAGHRQTAEEMESEAARSRFQLQNVLGKGAYGTVYSALDGQTGERVAIKVIPVTDQDREEFKQIQREIGFLADCNHPNVVRYLGSYRHPCELWIVMEYCGGGSVNDLLSASSEPLNEDIIAYICAEALKGLAYLHSLGKVHRDIKCGNILLTSSGDVKIADFGVSAQLTNTMSKRQTFIGTPHWMAPEVIQESRYDGKVDVWALGISAIEMAELRPPRWNVHPMRVIFMISRDPPPRLAQPDRWSPVFQDFVSQALLKDPKQRPTARYLLQHRFTMAQRAGVAAALLPLIQRAVQYLQEAALAAQQRQAEADTSILGGLATGRFSWRAGTVRADGAEASSGPALDATVIAAAATLRSGARGAVGLGLGGAHREREGEAEPASQPRPAPRGGRPPPPQPQSPSPLPGTPLSGVGRPSSSAGFDATVVVKEDYGGTVVVHEGFDTTVVRSDGGGGGHPALGGAAAAAAGGILRSPATPAQPGPMADYGATMVVAGGATLVERSGTVRRSSEADEGGADGDVDATGGGYLAAIRAAAAEVQHGDRHARPLESPAAGQPAPQLNEVERVRERLHSIYDGGLVVPLPFFRAEQAQPLALFHAAEPAQGQPLLTTAAPGPPRQQSQQQQPQQQGAAAPGMGGNPGMSQRRQQGPPPTANGAVAGSLPRGASLRQRPSQQQPYQQPSQHQPHQQQQQQTTAPSAGVDMCGVDPEAYDVVLELVQQSAAMALQRGEVASEQGAAIDSLPPTVLTQLLFHPVLQNLARTLAYNRRCLLMLPLDRRAQSELQESCNQLSAALQCVLSL